jgi:glycosyltransferase involved in cell wall biosynthesis
MKICILGRYPPQIGGIATHCEHLVGQFVKNGHEVTLITYKKLGRKGASFRIYEIPIIDVFFLRGLCYFLGTLAVLLRVRNEIELIHAHPIHPAGTAAIIFKLFHSVPVVITSHGSDLLKWAKIPLIGRLLVHIANSSDKLICVSRFLARKARKMGIKKEKIVVVHNGIEIANSLKKVEKKRLREELGLSKSRQTVLFVGSLTKEKRPDMLIQCARTLDADFVFVGTGPLRKKLEQFIKKFELENVKLIGPVERAVALKFIRAADVVAIPSSYEGFGLVGLEALSLGTAVVARPMGALRELLPIELQVTNFRKGLIKILTDKTFRGTARRKGRDVAARFTAKRMVRKIERVYQEVCQSTT